MIRVDQLDDLEGAHLVAALLSETPPDGVRVASVGTQGAAIVVTVVDDDGHSRAFHLRAKGWVS